MKQSHSIDEIRNVWWYSILTSYKTYVKNDTVRDTFHSNKMTFIFMNPYFLKDVITPEPYTKVACMKEKEYLRESPRVQQRKWLESVEWWQDLTSESVQYMKTWNKVW